MSNQAPASITVVRLKTSHYKTDLGLALKKELIYLKCSCQGYNILEEDCSNMGADEVIQCIVNLQECKDGVYEAQICNISTDWETGIVDDYDYQLVPFKPEEKKP